MPHSNTSQVLGSANIADSRKPSFNAQIGKVLKPGIKAAFLKRILLDLSDAPPNIILDNKKYKAFYDRMDLGAFAPGSLTNCICSFQIHHDGAYVVVVRCFSSAKPTE